MRRSEINRAVRSFTLFLGKNGWTLPPNPRWDVTDFGLGRFTETGLVLVNLAEEPEYCEKLMYASRDQSTPAHCHKKKKEDIICRNGILSVRLWDAAPEENGAVKEDGKQVKIKHNGEVSYFRSGERITLQPGERVTIFPGVWHEFHPLSEECIIGEVSTANDDVNDNFFANRNIGRFSRIEEDEEAVVRLLSE